jgi:hypothetical protein
MNEEKLEKQIEQYRELAKKDKKIDVASLMLNALQQHEANLIPIKQKRWAYLISLGIPPVGFLFALNFLLSDKDDRNSTALMCVILTVVSVILAILIGKAMFSTGVSTLKPSDLQGLY